MIDRFSGPNGDGPPSTGAASGRTTTTGGAATTAPPSSAPSTTAAPPSTTRPTSAEPTTTTRRSSRTTGLRSAEGVTIQILNGTGELRLARDFKPLVREEGYEVVRTANTNGQYQISTIFHTPGHKEDAVAFCARFPAFRIVAAAPSSLSTTVALHAVIGQNYWP